MSAPRRPLTPYDFGTTDRWVRAATRAIEEGLVVGTMQTKINLDPNEPVKITAHVMSSDGERWYDVELIHTAESLEVACDCRAGENCTPCKHIAAVLMEKKFIPVPAGAVPGRQAAPVPSRTLYEIDPVMAWLHEKGEA